MTVTDSAMVVYTGETNFAGNLVFENVAPGPGTVLIEAPPGFVLTIPVVNPFNVGIPSGPGAYTVPPIGLTRDTTAAPAPKMGMAFSTGDIIALVISGLTFATLMVALCRGAAFRPPPMDPEDDFDETTVTTTVTKKTVHHHHHHHHHPPPPPPASANMRRRATHTNSEEAEIETRQAKPKRNRKGSGKMGKVLTLKED